MTLLSRRPSELTKTTIGVYLVARAIGWLLLAVVERQLHWTRLVVRQPFRDWHEMMDRWDVFYYRTIAYGGYPTHLPIDDRGIVMPNVWAFFPAFPFLARAVASVTGLSFDTAAVLVNVTAGAMAAICLAQLARALTSEAAALRTVLFWSFFPTAFVLQVPYSEALYSVFAAVCLLALWRRQYWAAAAWLLGVGLTRGYAPPLSAAALCALLVDLRAQRLEHSGLVVIPRSVLRSGAAALVASACSAPFIWMTMASVATGRAGAYSATQGAWNYTTSPAVWIAGWTDLLQRLHPVDVATLVTIAGAVTLSLVAFLTRLPLFVKVYTACATMLICATALPGSVAFTSLPRFAFGVITLPMMLAIVCRQRWATGAVVVAFVGLQYLWILNIWSGRIGIAP